MRFNSTLWILGLLCLFLIIAALLQWYFESRKTEEDFSALKISNFYLRDYPIERDNALGEGPIDIIAFFDPLSDTKPFFETIGSVHNTYVLTNRSSLTINPIVLANQDNQKAIQFLCNQKEQPNLLSFWSLDTIINASCRINLTERMEESEYLGLHGLNARFYIGLGENYELVEGIASAQQIERAIRLKEITIGK